MKKIKGRYFLIALFLIFVASMPVLADEAAKKMVFDKEGNLVSTTQDVCSYCQQYRPIAFVIKDENETRRVCPTCIIKAIDRVLRPS